MVRLLQTALLVLLGCAHSDAATVLTRAQCLADLNEAFQIIESVHPNAFAITSRQTISGLRADLEKNLPANMDRTDFFLRVVPIVASLRDGHTSLRLPVDDYIERHGHSSFPLDVAFENDALIIANDWSESGLPKGSEVTRINDRSVEDIVQQLLPLQHAELESARRLNIAKYFRVYLALVAKLQPPFVVSHVPAGKTQETTRTLLESSLVEINARRRKGTTFTPYSYERLRDGNVGLISYNLCRQDAAFDEFLRSTFQQIQRDDINALVIDVRKNGGGSARANISLFNYITETKYRMFSGGDIKVSALVKAKLGKQAFERRFAPWETPDGTLVKERDEAQFFEATHNELRYAGPLFVLSGVGTQSSAMNFVNAVKDYRLGTIVGEETGDPATAFGDLESFRLSNSGLELYVSTKFFIRANGQLERRGIQPDFVVPQRREDTRLGRDSVLEFVKERVRKESRRAG